MTKLYLDIDGALVTKDGDPAEGVAEFLRFAVSNFDCYWLSTHCQGDGTRAFLYLVGKLPPESVPDIKRVKPTSWATWKTDAIDFSGDFYWLDDNPFDTELSVLRGHGTEPSNILSRLIKDKKIKSITAQHLLFGRVNKKQYKKYLSEIAYI